MNSPDIIDISALDSMDTININNSVGDSSAPPKSSNFGTGIELLMNDKKKHSSGGGNLSSDIDIGDLNNLEDELNDLTVGTKKSMKDARSDMFSGSFKLNEDTNDDGDPTNDIGANGIPKYLDPEETTSKNN